jgi:type I restriction enzyme S subunit
MVHVPLPDSKKTQRRTVTYLYSLQAKIDELKRLQIETEKELEELVPSILDKAFKGEL